MIFEKLIKEVSKSNISKAIAFISRYFHAKIVRSCTRKNGHNCREE